jgi:hypothetical protein
MLACHFLLLGPASLSTTFAKGLILLTGRAKRMPLKLLRKKLSGSFLRSWTQANVNFYSPFVGPSRVRLFARERAQLALYGARISA